MPAMMTITDAAAERIKGLMGKAGNSEKPVLGIRLGVKTRGCNGNAYEVEYATEEKPGDEIIEAKGIKIYVDASAQLMLFGTEMDYTEDKFQSGFSFKNPNEKGRCGCGESFHV